MTLLNHSQALGARGNAPINMGAGVDGNERAPSVLTPVWDSWAGLCHV